MGGTIPGGPPRDSWRGPWKKTEYLSLDFEATGLDFERDRIISFGFVPIRSGRVDLGDSRYQLVDPGVRAPDGETITLHGIRPVDLVGAPSQDVARDVIAEELEGRVLVAWYASVEAAFLGKLFGVRPRRIARKTIDVRNLLAALDDRRTAAGTLSEVAERCGVPVSSPHHALDDAIVTAQLFLVAATRLAERDGARTPRDLLRARPPMSPELRRPRAFG